MNLNIFVFSTLLLSLSIASCTTSADPAEEPLQTAVQAIAVGIAPVQSLAAAPVLEASGVVAAQENLSLSFKTGGIVSRVFVDEGQAVQAGQVVAKLDLAEIEAQVSQAEAALAKAERDLARTQRLYADSVATLEQVQDLRTAREVAAADLEVARFNQTHSVIKAPASGKVLRRFANPGEVVGPGTPVLSLSSRSQAQVIRVGLADVAVVQLQPGDRAEVTFVAFPGETFVAQVSEIAAGTDPRTGTYAVELAFLAPQRVLLDGMVGQVRIQPSGQSGLLQVPMGALVKASADEALVYVPDSAQTTAHPLSLRDYRILDSTLAAPATAFQSYPYVITDGARYLQAGSAIEVREGNKGIGQ